MEVTVEVVIQLRNTAKGMAHREGRLIPLRPRNREVTAQEDTDSLLLLVIQEIIR